MVEEKCSVYYLCAPSTIVNCIGFLTHTIAHVCIVPLIMPFAEAIYGTVRHLLLIVITVVNWTKLRKFSRYTIGERSMRMVCHTWQEFSAKIVPCIITLFDTSARSRYDVSLRVLQYYSTGSYEKLARRAKYASTFTLYKQNINRNPELFAFDLRRRLP